MSSATLRILAVLFATVAESFFAGAVSKAGPLMDTLIGPTTPRYPAPAAAAPPALPPAVVAPPVVSIPAAPSPAPCACAPSAAPACNPCPSCPSPVATTYVRQTAYRTKWVRVPVTVYRPVTTADPVTGCPVTCMQPCTTTAWQARRVPTSCWRSCWDSVRSLFSCRRRQAYALPVAAPPMVAAAGCSSCPATLAPAAGCSSCSPSLTPAPPQPAPYYPSSPGPATLAPPPAAAPSMIGPPPAAAPPAVGAPPSSSPSPGPTPADRPPSLNPSELQNANPGPETRGYPSAPDPSSPSKGEAAQWGGDRPESPTWDARLRPVPDPDSPRATTPAGQAPQLLNPRDRTALAAPIARAGAYTPIAWPDAAETASAGPARTRPQESWDDSGWRSLRP